jgi:hypothetical protein
LEKDTVLPFLTSTT